MPEIHSPDFHDGGGIMKDAATKTVLLVEDDADIRDSLQDILEDEGFDVIPAANGKQAIDFLTLNDPIGADLVILDLLMPMVSDLHARGRNEEVVRRFTIATRVALQLTLPTAVAFAVFASDIVHVWLGGSAPRLMKNREPRPRSLPSPPHTL